MESATAQRESTPAPMGGEDASDAQHELSTQYLTFSISKEEYGVNIMQVKEIRGWSDTTRLPNSVDYMRGVINLRGSIIPIFDLRARFNMGQTEATEKHVVVILDMDNRTFGLLVDAVSDILDVTPSQVNEAPHGSGGNGQVDDAFVSGLISVNEKMVVVLDVEHLFSNATLDQAAKATKSEA